MRHFTAKPSLTIALIGTLVFGAACETIKKVSTVKVPKVQASDALLSRADFSSLDFVVNLDIDNPNPYGLSVAGFEYDLQVETHSLLAGSQSDTQTLKASEHSTLAVPMNLSYADLVSAIPEILKRDSFDYLFTAQLQLKVPVLDSITVPISKTGTLPVIRPPKISNLSLKKKRINLTGADLEINLSIENPNGFEMQMKALDYSFKGNDQLWATGKTPTPLVLGQKSESALSIPIRLDFLAIGKTALQLLSGGKSFTSSFEGNMTLNSNLDYLPERKLPVSFQKTLSLD